MKAGDALHKMPFTRYPVKTVNSFSIAMFRSLSGS